MEENNKSLKKKVAMGVATGILIGCLGTTGYFKYQQSKSPTQDGRPPMGEVSEDMIPEGLTQEEFEEEMKNGKSKPDKSNNLNKENTANDDVNEEEITE